MRFVRSVYAALVPIVLQVGGVAHSQDSDDALRNYAEAAAIVVYANDLCIKANLSAHNAEDLKAVIRPMLLRIGRAAAESALMEGHITAEKTFRLAASESDRQLFCSKIYEFAEKLLKAD